MEYEYRFFTEERPVVGDDWEFVKVMITWHKTNIWVFRKAVKK